MVVAKEEYGDWECGEYVVSVHKTLEAARKRCKELIEKTKELKERCKNEEFSRLDNLITSIYLQNPNIKLLNEMTSDIWDIEYKVYEVYKA